MEFEQYGQSSQQQPQQRRRRVGKKRQRTKVPITARLALDPQLRGNTGILSEDIANSLFSHHALMGK